MRDGEKSFSDEDVSNLLHATEGYGFRKDIEDLLARLEAAEAVCEHIKENGFPKTLRDIGYDLMNTWRKAAGRE